MEKTLAAVVVPVLRKDGFTGSFPHFRRRRDGLLDLLTFQFDRHGGGFVVEIGHTPDAPFDPGWGTPIPPAKLRAWDLRHENRMRIRPPGVTASDYWYRYDRGELEDAARQVLAALPSAEAWWRARSLPDV